MKLLEDLCFHSVEFSYDHPHRVEITGMHEQSFDYGHLSIPVKLELDLDHVPELIEFLQEALKRQEEYRKWMNL